MQAFDFTMKVSIERKPTVFVNMLAYLPTVIREILILELGNLTSFHINNSTATRIKFTRMGASF